jgi:hypothetical protein
VTDEQVVADQGKASAEGSEPDEDITVGVLRRVVRILAHEDPALARRIQRSQDNYEPILADYFGRWEITPDDLLIASTVIVFGKAYIESLARRAGDGTVDLLKRIRFRRERGTGDTLLEVDGRAAAAVVVTEDLPDEARLALLDLDVTAPDLRGQELRWDEAGGGWRPSEAQRDG